MSDTHAAVQRIVQSIEETKKLWEGSQEETLVNALLENCSRIALALDANSATPVHPLVMASIGQLILDAKFFTDTMKTLGELRR